MKLEDGLIAKDALTRRTAGVIIRNTGKLVALLTAFIAILLSFTDVSLGSIGSRAMTGNLLLMLVSAYLIYFSLEDAGEKLGEDTEQYREALAAYKESVGRVSGSDVGALRSFCAEYSARELEYRQRCALMNAGLCPDDLGRYLGGESFDKGTERALRRIAKMKAHTVTPTDLLGSTRGVARGELSDPARFKTARLALKLLPTVIFMCLTVSVALSAKEGLTPEVIIESVVRLSTLPMVAFRGYSAGYSFTKNEALPKLNTKKRILDAFLTTLHNS